MRELDDLFATHVQAGRVGAIVDEPILGEGGFVVPPMNFFRELRARADRYGILLIVDEVQTGIGRTGRMFAIEHFGVEPDLMTVAKSIAVGLPVSAVVGARDIINALPEGSLRGTYFGNPVAFAAALAVLPIIGDQHLVARAAFLRERIRTQVPLL